MEERNSVHHEPAAALPEHRETLWLLTFAPGIWALHFVLSYATVAIWCAKAAGRDGALGDARVAVGIYTALACAGIAATAWRGWRQASWGSATVPHDFDTDADRHRFIGFATVLLAGLSLVATLFVGAGALIIRSCL